MTSFKVHSLIQRNTEYSVASTNFQFLRQESQRPWHPRTVSSPANSELTPIFTPSHASALLLRLSAHASFLFILDQRCCLIPFYVCHYLRLLIALGPCIPALLASLRKHKSIKNVVFGYIYRKNIYIEKPCAHTAVCLPPLRGANHPIRVTNGLVYNVVKSPR